MKYFLFLVVILLGASCGSDRENLATAKGAAGDLYVVIDSAQRRGPIGALLDSILGAEMPGLPRPEPIFNIHWVDARKLNYVLKERRVMLYVMTLDRRSQGASIVRSFFTPESISKVASNPDQFMTTTEDVFARNQQVMYLYSKDEETLAAHLRANASRIVAHFNLKEREHLNRALFRSGRMKGISDLLSKEFKCTLQFPFGYKMADKTPDFLWARQVNPRDDKDIFLARKPYASQADFSRENLIKFRDEICRKHLFGDPDEHDSYLITETTVPFIPVTADTINFHGRFAVQLRGLWRTNTPGLGGPFLGYAFVDEGTQQFYYIEGFTISPSRPQREIMRELETILHTFQTSQELTAATGEPK